MAPISSKFVANLKRLTEMPRRMKEFEKLGGLMKLRKEREKLIPKEVDKKKKLELS